MTVDIITFLIVCPLVFLAGFVDAVAGGGGLISLPAYMIAGLPVHYAIGTNKLSSGVGSLFATYRFAKKGYIKWKRAGICVIFALIGSMLGANIALLITDHIFKMLMLVIIPVTAFYIIRCKSLEDNHLQEYSNVKTNLICIGIAFVIGVYDGFYGPGTGTFLLLLLTSLAHIKLSSANGIAKVINVTTNLSALAVYVSSGKIVVLLGIVAALFSLLGNYLGTKLFDKSGAKAVKPIMIFVLCVFFIKVVLEVF